MIAGLASGVLAGSGLERHIARGEVIPQAESCPDKQVPEVTWDQYGVVPTDEVAVVARCGPARFFAKAQSYLLVPPMADRIFGLDVDDQRLGHELAEYLWGQYGAELMAAAERQRAGPAA
ncbi:hypothetical protein [Algiphilus aromaticivorans]|uniref:hypothetical protein n=1 Tax=Algiphilus aromaticivorans TaxID=382454 RepID=UPI0005C13B19|nr:hypothetical protein [Algiphilus aromaticivorans]